MQKVGRGKRWVGLRQVENRRASKMREPEIPSDPDRVACKVCFKEIPLSEAVNEEATDYVLHFCGLDCYAKWKTQSNPLLPENENGNNQ
jgi:hypothetical protein